MRSEDGRWQWSEGRGENEGKEEEMLSHVLPGRMLPAPLLIFNEARRNIMQMSLNGAWTTAPKQGHRLLHPPPLRLPIYPPSFSVLLIAQFVCVLTLPLFFLIFSLMPSLPP